MERYPLKIIHSQIAYHHQIKTGGNFGKNNMTLQERIDQYQKQNYNPYYWWRRFKSRDTLHKYQPLEAKIKNGDYETSDYHWWILWENELEKKAISEISEPDRQHETRCLFGERRRRLMDDFERDEAKILEAMYKDFKIELKMSQEEVENEMLDFEGTLAEFYYYIRNKKNIKRQYDNYPVNIIRSNNVISITNNTVCFENAKANTESIN